MSGDYGVYGSAHEHTRAMVEREGRRGRRWCPFCRRTGRDVRITHMGTANGVVLMSACEWHVRMWVKTPDSLQRRSS